MRILIVSQYYYPERVSVSDIAEELVKLGHKVSVITGKPNYGFHKILPEYKKVKFEVINGVEVYRINLLPRKFGHVSISLNYLSFYFNARRFIRHFKEDYDVVLSISLSPVISISPAILYAKKHHVPHVLFCEDLWPESTVFTNAVRKDSLIYKLLFKWSVSLYRNCDEIIISSPSFKEYFEKVLNITDKSFVHINQPIIKSKNDTIESKEYSHKYNFVYAGNLTKLQLVDKLVESFSKINDEDVTLHLMGMGSELPNIEKYVEEKHLENKIIYHGALPIEEAEQFYLNADALIVSLKDAGYVGKTIPNKAIQYLKYGRPILGIIKGDGENLLKEANGTIFSSQKEEDIVDAIRKIISLTKEEKSQLGKNNKTYFEENLTSEKLVKEIEQELLKQIKVY